ncbi:MAG: CPBP family intramembrane glutamic endopeptidase [Bacillota bacterium]
MNHVRKQRLRLLGVAGVLAPAAMVLAGFALSWLARREFPDLAHLPGWRTVLLGVLTAGLSMGLITLLYKSSKRFEQALRQSGTRVGEEALRVAGYPVMLVVVVMAGLGEEVLFRGGLQPLIGIVPAALLFGFSHGGWRREMWAYAIAAAISGVLFGTVYHLTGNLWVSIIAHALHNVMATLLLGKRVEVTREGFWPVIRLVAEEPDEASEPEESAELVEPVGPVEPVETQGAAESEEETQHEPGEEPEPMGEPVPAETDSPDDGPDDRPAPHRPAE